MLSCSFGGEDANQRRCNHNEEVIQSQTHTTFPPAGATHAGGLLSSAMNGSWLNTEPMPKETIRLRVTSKTYPSNVSYIKIKGELVRVFSSSYQRSKPSSIFNKPAETIFALEKCASAQEAINIIVGDNKTKTVEEI